VQFCSTPQGLGLGPAQPLSRRSQGAKGGGIRDRRGLGPPKPAHVLALALGRVGLRVVALSLKQVPDVEVNMRPGLMNIDVQRLASAHETALQPGLFRSLSKRRCGTALAGIDMPAGLDPSIELLVKVKQHQLVAGMNHDCRTSHVHWLGVSAKRIGQRAKRTPKARKARLLTHVYWLVKGQIGEKVGGQGVGN